MMKKISVFLLISLLALMALTACGTEPAEPTAQPAVTAAPDAPQPQNQAANGVTVAEKGVAVTIIRASEWADKYPEIYASYMANSEKDERVDYVEVYPMLSCVYEGMGFNTYYDSARSHLYTITDVTGTGRPHKLANCFSCKTADYSVLVNETNGEAYSYPFDEVAELIQEPISCYSCHANTPGEFTVSNTYLADAMGEDFASIPAATLSCAQCHNEYHFAGEFKQTTLPYTSLATMNPDAILDFYNRKIVDGQVFADYTNPRTGVRQIKVQHPEFETFMGEGSIHANDFTCADCHMGKAVSEEGKEYTNHTWTSPLDNPSLIESTCSECHTDLRTTVLDIQERIERSTYATGYLLESLTERLVQAVESGEYTDEELDQIRSIARDAQFYWDFVFVENSEGAHNSALSEQCLNKSQELINKAMALFK